MEEEKMSSIDVREMALKWTTQTEVYRVLIATAEVYLPSIDQINCYFVRDLLSGDKLVGCKIYSEVYRLKSPQDNWSYTFGRVEDFRSAGVCKKSLRYRSIYTGVWLWKISFQKMDMRRW